MLWKTQIRIEIKCFEGLFLKREQKYNKEVLGKYTSGEERMEISLYGFSYGQDSSPNEQEIVSWAAIGSNSKNLFNLTLVYLNYKPLETNSILQSAVLLFNENARESNTINSKFVSWMHL